MPYRRGRIFYVDLRPPGYPHRLCYSTGQRTKRVAKDMEATIRALAQRGRFDALDGLREQKYALPALHAAYTAGRLEALLEDRKDPPLAKAVVRFLAGSRDPRYRRAVDVLLRVAPTGVRASWCLDPRNLQRVVHDYRERGLAAGTERRELAGISKLIRHLHGERERRRVFSELDIRRGKNRQVDPFTPRELEALRKAAGPDWWRPIALSAATGIRRGELLALRCRNVDLRARALRIEKGKTEAAKRRVPLGGELLATLGEWTARQSLAATDPLFPALTDNLLRKAWHQIRAAADLDGRRWHSLRHTFGAEMARAGMPLPELRRLMGHTSIETTMIYADYSPPTHSAPHEKALRAMGLGEAEVRKISATGSNSDGDRSRDVA